MLVNSSFQDTNLLLTTILSNIGWKTDLSFHSSVAQFLSQKKSHLVVFCGLLKLPQEDVSVAEVTVGSPLRAAVAELLGNLQSLLVIVNSFGEVSQEIVNIAEVPASSALGSSILESKIELLTLPRVN